MDHALYASLGELLEYPGPRLAAPLAACVARLEAEQGEAAAHLREFARIVERTPPGRLQECYTAAFDLDGSCSPHVGYRLLGADPRRAVFLSRLAARYRARGFSCGRELPDHVAVLLRFVAHAPDEPDLPELLRDCLAPALATLADELERRQHPYAAAAAAVRAVVEADAREEGSR